MSEKDNFSEVIDSKMNELQEQLSRINQNIADPQYHSGRVRNAIRDALEQVSEIKDPEMMKVELISIVNQMPGYVESAWAEAANMRGALGAQLQIWKDVQKEYESTLQAEEEDTTDEEWKTSSPDSEFLDAVRLGDIEEPSTRTAIRRKPGTRPESLRKVRNAKTLLQNSPEQK